MKEIYDKISHKCSKLVTQNYSTSFTLGIKLFHSSIRRPIYDIYGFVRLADEIVDTFFGYGREEMFYEFYEQLNRDLERGISTNPILQSFIKTVNEYNIPHDYIHAFMKSMQMDLERKEYTREEYNEYIYGSAEVIGLMCLKVFVKGNDAEFEKLKECAQILGSAFQKVNFLRDIKSDFSVRQRVYFPGVDFKNFEQNDKNTIIEDIDREFRKAYTGILELPSEARLGVYVAYRYYFNLLHRLKKKNVQQILSSRTSVPNAIKLKLLLSSAARNKFGLL